MLQSFYFTGTATATGVKSLQGYNNPKRFDLEQNYPNPFNPVTKIEYSVPVNSNITIKVFDILGNEICTLFDGKRKPGNYEVTFNGSRLSSGIYLYQMISDHFMKTKKLVFLK